MGLLWGRENSEVGYSCFLRRVNSRGGRGGGLRASTPWVDPERRAASTRNTILHSPFCDLQQDLEAFLQSSFT